MFDCLHNYNLDHVKVEIFMCLDYKSLHLARQVSKGWRDFIDKEIWSARRSHALGLIAEEWRNNEPTQRIIECPSRVRDLTVDDKILLAESFLKILVLAPSSGKSIDVIQGLSTKIRGSWDTVHGNRDISSRIIAMGIGHGSVPGQMVIWDRSTLKLLCSVHLPGNEEYLTNDEYRTVEYVRCVKTVGDFVVAGGFDGTLTAFSIRSILAQEAPNQNIINDFEGSPLEIGFWKFTDLFPIEDTVTIKMDEKICFLEKDGTWLLVLSNNEGALWDFSSAPNLRTKIEGISGRVSGRVTDCALKYPYAFFATRCKWEVMGESSGHKIVEIWDIDKNYQIRKIQIVDPGTGTLCITVNRNFLASKIRGGSHRQQPKSSIFIHDIEELVNKNLSNDALWMKKLEYPVFDDVSGMIVTSFYIAINSSSLFAISGYGCKEGHKRIYIWDFVNNKNDFDSVGGSVKCVEKESFLKRLKNWTRKK